MVSVVIRLSGSSFGLLSLVNLGRATRNTRHIIVLLLAALLFCLLVTVVIARVVRLVSVVLLLEIGLLVGLSILVHVSVVVANRASLTFIPAVIVVSVVIPSVVVSIVVSRVIVVTRLIIVTRWGRRSCRGRCFSFWRIAALFLQDFERTNGGFIQAQKTSESFHLRVLVLRQGWRGV